MRTVKQIAKVTAAAGATADTGILDVEEFHSLGVIVTVAGLASGAVTSHYIDETGAAIVYQSNGTVAIGTVIAASIGRDCGGAGPGFPVPRRWQATAVSGATGTVTITVYGVADEPDNV